MDALAGGGGLITLPAYLAAGLDPALILGTNKLASSIGTTASAWRYLRGARLSARLFWPPLAVCALSAFLGARLALLLDPAFLRPLLLVALPVLTTFLLFKRRFAEEDSSGSLGPRSLRLRASGLGLGVGAYDGFFGPGTGTFFALGLARFCRYDLLRATGYAKLLNLASNVAALAGFLAAGRVRLSLGLAMGAASVAGHWTGSHLGVSRGSALIRPMLVLLCAGLFLKLLLG